jgi:hypothetical protein
MISLVHGWRLRRVAGKVDVRCPPCNERYRASRSAPSTKPLDRQAGAPAPAPHSVSPGRVPVAKQFRSTWLTSSLAALRERGLIDRYLSVLPQPYHPVVTGNIAGTWLPIDVAIAHYAACDQLDLSAHDVLAIGREVTKRVHGSALRMFITLAQGLGVTPWTALARASTLWRRCWDGGDVAAVSVGPKEARVEIAGWPCAGTSYCRVACRGMITAVVEPFCAKVYVREDPALCGALTLGFVVAWV